MSSVASESRPFVAITRSAALAGVLVLAGACATFRMPTPDGFAPISRSWSHRTALTSDEDKLLVRHFGSRVVQSPAFWADTVRNNLVEQRGYTLVEEGATQSDAGLAGHRFLFELSMGDVPYRHLLVVFTTQGRDLLLRKRQHVYTVEFLCEKRHFEKHGPAVEKALKQFKPRRGRAGQEP